MELKSAVSSFNVCVRDDGIDIRDCYFAEFLHRNLVLGLLDSYLTQKG